MPETQSIPSNTTLRVHKSTHAPLFELYMGDDGYEPPGEPGEYGPVDPDTGAEYKALGGPDHRYNRDYKVGSSYPETGFFTATDGEEESLSHDELESLLKTVGLNQYRTKRVIIPKGYVNGRPTWLNGIMVSPPDQARYLIGRAEKALKRAVEDPDRDVYVTRSVVEASFW